MIVGGFLRKQPCDAALVFVYTDLCINEGSQILKAAFSCAKAWVYFMAKAADFR
jgi:hypothetical protein